MKTEATQGTWLEVDHHVEAFEAARKRDPRTHLAQHLPSPDHPRYLEILGELIRVDLEQASARGQVPSLRTYLSAFPSLRNDRKVLSQVAFEHFRQRHLLGQDPNPSEYVAAFGVDTEGWARTMSSSGPQSAANASLPAKGRGLSPRRDHRPGSPASDLGTLLVARDFQEAMQGAISEIFSTNPSSTPEKRPQEGLPEVGDRFLDFWLLAELGRGTFGRAFLARQANLAGRLVVLKVSTDLLGEPNLLAQLQHTNIVPIYSVHHAGRLHGVCMPYLGVATLADVVAGLRGLKHLPESGHHLLSTIEDRHRSTRIVSPSPSQFEGSVQPPACAPLLPRHSLAPEAAPHLSAGYVEAIAWLMARLADGLQHAHGRGIYHRDLKPANVLLSDQGQPMLLDFNLADDERLRQNQRTARLGGTLPYMAPESLRALIERGNLGDHRSDLYSLGVVFYELLTARFPFPLHCGTIEEVVPRMLVDRQAGVTRARSVNRQVSHALDAIVAKCLEPDPARRYQSAAQLAEDLERELTHQPLRHVAEPSLRERFQKWQRRHPRLTSGGWVAAGAGLLLAMIVGVCLLLWNRLEALDAQRAAQGFLHRYREVEAQVSLRDEYRDGEQEFRAEARRLLSQYVDPAAPAWPLAGNWVRLPAFEQRQVSEAVGFLAFGLARAEAALASRALGSAERQRHHDAALKYNTLAREAFDDSRRPAAVDWQREDLLRPKISGSRSERQPKTSRDAFLLATDRYLEGRFAEALAFASQAANAEPSHFAAHFLVGNCHLALAQDRQAEHAFDICVALWPEYPWSLYNRGLARHRLGALRQAEEDFTQVLKQREHFTEARLGRAQVRLGSKDYEGAIKDLTWVLDRGEKRDVAMGLRARAHEAAGNAVAAQADREAALKLQPADEQAWVARGLALLPAQPQLAVAAFDRAIALNPRSRAARQNKAYVLSEIEGKLAEAVAVLDDVLRDYPEYLPSLGGRGVLLARLGRRAAAHADGRKCLELSHRPETAYQVAGIFALTSTQVPADRHEALRLLARALSQDGYGLDLIAIDTDLDPIRKLPEFNQMVSAAQLLRKASAAK